MRAVVPKLICVDDNTVLCSWYVETYNKSTKVWKRLEMMGRGGGWVQGTTVATNSSLTVLLEFCFYFLHGATLSEKH